MKQTTVTNSNRAMHHARNMKCDIVTGIVSFASVRRCVNVGNLRSLDLRVGSSKSTWAFQVGSSRSVVVSPSKFSGAVGLITNHFKSTWPIILHLAVLSYKSYTAIDEFGRIGQFVTSFSNRKYIPVYRLGCTGYRVSTLRTAQFAWWGTCESA